MDITKHRKEYKEFCELFKDLSIEEAISKASELNLSVRYDGDCDLVDINYKNICATIYLKKDGTTAISEDVECWNGSDGYEIYDMDMLEEETISETHPFKVVRINYIDKDRHVAFIDGWLTDNDNEEGVVIGEIDLATNHINPRDGYASDILLNEKVIEVVNNFIDNHPPTPKPKQLFCACCKRPFRPNIGCYNFPNVGVTCIDCVDRAKKLYGVKESSIKLESHVARYMRECGSHYNTASANVTYDKDKHMPFIISVMVGDWEETTSFTTLDDIKAIHSALGKFIAECKI